MFQTVETRILQSHTPTTRRQTVASYTLSSGSILEPVENIKDAWHEAKPYIQRVLGKMGDPTPIESIYADLLTYDRQLWMVHDEEGLQAVILTIIDDYRGQKIGLLTHAAGRGFQDWTETVDPIAGYFNAAGCNRFQIIGRKGWKKFIEDKGFKETDTIFERTLNG